MGGIQIDNRTPFAFSPLFVVDESGRPIVSTIVKATFDASKAKLQLAEEQEPVDFSGKHHGEPGKSSVRIDPEVAFVKPGTDCVLLGHATVRHPTPVLDVSFSVGPIGKYARVYGDRWWVQGSVGLTMTAPQPFERIPLVYERAFGGWDRSNDDPKHHDCEQRNPVGVGFVARHGSVEHGAPVPNIEDPANPLTSVTGRVPPIGFGFIGCDWEPRVRYAGTYDEAWEKNRSPLLPVDFDRRFFNAAPAGLATEGYLSGDERVLAVGVTPEGRWEFSLPGVHAPRCHVALHAGATLTLQTNLDTVIVDADARRVLLLWRAFAPLRTGPHDVSAIQIESDNFTRPRTTDEASAESASVT